MSNKYFSSELRNAMAKVQQVMEAAGNHEIKKDLRNILADIREYRRANREGRYDYLNSYPCGYQDAHYDRLVAIYDRYEILKDAWRYQQAMYSNEYSKLAKVKCLNQLANVQRTEGEINEPLYTYDLTNRRFVTGNKHGDGDA
jgi:hypothetical protein